MYSGFGSPELSRYVGVGVFTCLTLTHLDWLLKFPFN